MAKKKLVDIEKVNAETVEIESAPAAKNDNISDLESVEQNLLALSKELDESEDKHHNKGVLDLTIGSALNGIEQLKSQILFIEKAVNEKKK